MAKRFPFFKQFDTMDCGPACLRMVAAYHGRYHTLQTLRNSSGITKNGVSLSGISKAAEAIGLKTYALTAPWGKLKTEDIVPFIAHWGKNHFVVVYKITNRKVYVADPAKDLIVYSEAEFLQKWLKADCHETAQGVALLLEPTPAFAASANTKKQSVSFRLLAGYLWTYKSLLVQLASGLLLGTLLLLIFPFLTKSVVDTGIGNRDIGFIYIILIAQFVLYLGQTSVEFLRSWILLHINTRINLSLLSDFLAKLMRLPISFFESKMTGDIIQRINDQQRIQNFLTGPALTTLFSLVNFIVFTIVIASYNVTIFLVFLAGSAVYLAWITLFLRYRRNLDYRRFTVQAQSQSSLFQLVYGMQEIKMNNSETLKRWQWERLQAKIFEVSMKSLQLGQYQQGGATLINQLKNISITLFSAVAVVKGSLTLGEMIAIQYITGQLNSPLEQFVQLVQSMQDANISMERMNEVYKLEDEEPEGQIKLSTWQPQHTVTLQEVSFAYPGSGEEAVLKKISLTIPTGKTTAFIGASGSGKTTLLKLLLQFYPVTEGMIMMGDIDLADISQRAWREQCGAVFQDSYIFSDSIANNIAVKDETPDAGRLDYAIHTANISEFIESLPEKWNTRIGEDGHGISQGQKQRILIARAVYKNPAFIFFDEATNALDANNEKTIINNLNAFFEGRTVILSAHRLSTVRQAHQIVVLDKGTIAEKGTHDELMEKKGAYYELIRNQL